MNFIIDENMLLRDIPYNIYTELKISLEQNAGLENIKVHCSEIFQIIQPTYLEMSCKSPIEQMLANLMEEQCTINMLTEILRASKLFNTLSIFLTEQMEIKRQPTDNLINNIKKVRRGKKLSLEFSVWGIPQPNYHWYKDNTIVSELPILQYETYTVNLAGCYYCEAIQTYNDNTTKILRSNFVQVETLEERCVIIEKPRDEICVRETVVPQEIELKVIAEGYPLPEYEWIHQNKIISNKSPVIKITNEKKFEGLYHCRVSNAISEDIVIKTNVKVLETLVNIPIFPGPVAEKIAILIGNEKYEKHDRLTTPVNDINAIREILINRGFLTLSYYNTSLKVMQAALRICEKLCVPDSLIFFYYSGHGFHFGEKYLMPVDTSENSTMRLDECISESEVLYKFLNKKPKLLVTVLDMCLKFLNSDMYDEKPKIFLYKSNRNLIQAYSTSMGASSYEKCETKNSAYNLLLQSYIVKNTPILQMFAKIKADFSEIVKKDILLQDQAPSTADNVDQDYCLDLPKIGNPTSEKLYKLCDN